MKKILFYAMRGEKMCFLHVLMNALDCHAQGHTVRIILEGESVRLVQELMENPLMQEAVTLGLVAGICEGCSRQLKVLEKNQASGLPLLADMKGHAGMAPFIEEGYQVVSM